MIVLVFCEFYGSALDERKELFDKLIKKWDEIFSNPKLFELTDIEQLGCLELYTAYWETNYDYIVAHWATDYREYPRYLCKCADGELISSIDRQNICLEFTKKDLTLWFNLKTYVITGTARDCVSLSLSFKR